MAGKSLTPNRIALFGDSYTASYAFGTSPGASGGGWYNNAQALAVHPFPLPPLNFGVGSEQTDDILARIDDVTAVTPTVVHVLGGTNDIAFSRAAVDILADLESICDGLLATESVDAVILGTIIPQINHQTAPKLAILDAVNTGIRSYAAATTGVYLAEYCLALAADGNTLDDSSDLIDDVHPSKSGNAKMAQVLAPVLTTVAAYVASLD